MESVTGVCGDPRESRNVTFSNNTILTPAPYQGYGMFQVNARVPQGLGPGPQPVVLTVGQANNASQQVTVAVQ